MSGAWLESERKHQVRQRLDRSLVSGDHDASKQVMSREQFEAHFPAAKKEAK